MPRTLNKKLLAAGVVLAAVFFALAPKSPLTAWLLNHGISNETINTVANAAGLAGLVLVFLSVTRVSIEEDLGEARLNISVPLWLVLALLGALTYEGLARLTARLLGPEAPKTVTLGVSAVIFFIAAIAVGLMVSRRTRKRARVLIVVGRLDRGEGER